jgi:tetratricopeptide (TPR) repeat protein
LANAYKKQGNYEQALSYLKKDLEDTLEKNTPSLLSEIGNLYYAQKKYPDALSYYQDAYQIAQKNRDIQACSFSTNNIGLVYVKTGDYAQAVKYYQLSLGFSKEVGNNRDYTNTLSNLSQLAIQQKEYQKALQYAQEGFNNANALKDYPLLLELADVYIQIYQALKDDKQVINYQQLVIAYKDSIYLQTREKDIVAITMQSQIATDKQSIKYLANENAVWQTYTWAGVVAVVFLLVFIVLLYSRMQLRKKVMATQEENIEAMAAKESAENALKMMTEQTLQERIDYQNRILATQSLLLAQKQELMEKVEQHLVKFAKILLPEQKEQLKIITKDIQGTLQQDNDWSSYKLHFEEVHPNFFKILQHKCPQLTANDLRVCAYLRMQLSNKEIATLMGISTDSFKVNLSRLKTKVQLGKEQDLREYIEQL